MNGLRLRDYFAALAMQSMLSNLRTTELLSVFPAGEVEEKISVAVYAMADAMIKARGK